MAPHRLCAGEAPSLTCVISAHMAKKIIGVVTVQAADRPAAVAVALAVVSEAPRPPAASPSQLMALEDGPADLIRGDGPLTQIIHAGANDLG
jgi:hypothetical protein